jgi:3-oxocholest-4-en-26-oyl-CoA dehydrogenase beta subunit
VDFSFSEDEQAVDDLARRILEDQVSEERLDEAGLEGIDRRCWTELAKANVLGLALPTDAGGSGLGFLSGEHPHSGSGCCRRPLPVSRS